MDLQYDIVVVGCGPAGMSAAVNGKARNKKVLIVGGELCSPKLYRSHQINNYLGIPGVTGADLRQLFLDHVEQAEVEIEKDKVTSVMPLEEGFFVQTKGMGQFTAGTVVLAVGVTSDANLPGEKEFLGRGVSSCATCDAMFYRGKPVAVVAYSKSAEEEVRLLSEVSSHVYFLPQYEEGIAGDFADNVEIIMAEPKAIEGDKVVGSLVLEQDAHSEGESFSGQGPLQVNGVFVIRETVPVEQLVPGIELADSFIKVDTTMATSVPGVFAAGDCVGEPFQVAKAVGQGQVAALSAANYLSPS